MLAQYLHNSLDVVRHKKPDAFKTGQMDLRQQGQFGDICAIII